MTEVSKPFGSNNDTPPGRCRALWRGREWMLWGSSLEDCGIMTSEAATDCFDRDYQPPYAWVNPDGKIYRHGEVIGHAMETELLEPWR